MIPRELFRKIRHVEIRTKGLVENVFGGEYHSAFRGRGIEFSEVRPYQFGDDVRSIDWNVSARMGEPYIKLFEEEREQTLMLVVDISGSGDFGSGGKTKREIAAEMCAVLGFSAVRNNDKVGLLLFSDEVERFVPPKKGRQHVLRIVRDLFVHPPASRGTNINAALDHVHHVLNRRAIVVLVSDFLDVAYDQTLRMLSRKHDVVAIRLLDPREETIPRMGLVALKDAETGRPALVDTSSKRVRNAFTEKAAERESLVQDALKRARVDTVTVRTDHDYVDPLVAFFKRRNRER
ncbi:MAG: DUF58 domain-containing protein [Rubricoccaceae bacterium]|nr:DUF58 domain-containing protein [Rubricoccaceae bacterium]